MAAGGEQCAKARVQQHSRRIELECCQLRMLLVGHCLAGPALQLPQGYFAYFAYSAHQELGQPTFAVVGTDPTALFPCI